MSMRRLAAGIAVIGLVLAGCAAKSPTGAVTPSPTGSVPLSDSPSVDTASPSSSDGTPLPSDSASASDGASPSGGASPSDGGPASGSASPSAASSSGEPTPTPPPATCAIPVPVKVGRIDVDVRHTTETAVVVSDGRSLTPGSSEQTDFTEPVLTGADGTQIADPATNARIGFLVGENTRHKVMLTRPDAPDTRADVTKRPFTTPGTYVLYNASSVLTVDVTVVCATQQQRWTFTAEGDPSTGTVNCAVEPARGNVIARLVYQSSC